MTDEQFEEVRHALLVEVSQPAKRLGEQTTRVWRELTSGRLSFEQRKLKIAAVPTLTRSEVFEFFERACVNQDTRRKFVCHAFGKSTASMLKEVR